jgi:hypothetical protein
MKSTSGTCKHVRELRLVLWNNQITEKSIETMAAKLPELCSLEKIYINLSNNKIGDGGVRLLGKSMIDIPLLREIKLGFDSTGTTEVGCRYIGRMLSVLKKDVKKLSQLWLVLEGCKVTDDGIILLSKVLPRLKQLQSVYINLADCSLFDDAMFTLIHSIQTNVETVKEISLDLRRNIISPVMKNRILY